MIKDEIIPQLRQTFREVLVHINETANQRIEENRKDLIKKITEHFEQIQREIKSDFNYSDPFFFRTRDLLEKKLNALNLFDFTLIPNDVNWALTRDNHKNEDEKEQYARNLYIGKNNGCHNILGCIVDDLFQNLIYPGNADNLRRRMKSNIRNKVEKMQESDLDIFSFLLNHFAEKMEKINKSLYNKEFEGDFSQMVKCAKGLRDSAILFAMFFFYMNQQYLPEQAGCTTSGLRQCGWEYVNKRIATALTKINKERARLLYSLSVEDSRRQFYETFDSLIFIPVCNEDPKLYDTDDRCSISELMCKENHFAVFSTRFSKYDPWKHRLIRLRYLRNNYSENELLGSVENDVNDIPTILDVLKYQPRNKQECTSRWAFLDHWHKETIDTMKKEWSTFTDPLKRQNPTGRNSYRDLQDDRVWGNPMTRWIVRKLPSVSLGSDSNGNNRLNVLASRSEAHVFFDARMIWLLLERTHSKYRTYHAQRFSTTVWDGLDNLACKDVSTYILTVNRGTIAEENKKSQMLLGFGSDLPNAIRIKLISAKDLLVDDSTFVQTGEKLIYSFFDLLDAIKESYSGVGLVPDFGMEQVHKLINEYHNIMQMRPFHRNQRDQDMEVVKILQEYCNAHPEIKPDRELMARDNRMLEQKVLSAYTSFLFDHSKVKKFSERIAYTDIKIPVDRHAFMCAVLIQLYGIKLDEIPRDLKEAIVRTLYGRDSFKELNVEQYSNENKLNKACTDIQIALAYCDRWAKLDFRNAFLEQICNWYWDNIWNNGSASTFLQYTQKYLLKDCSNQELEVLYKMQLRRIFCAAIIDCETAYF